jgi:hypothetical protein
MLSLPIRWLHHHGDIIETLNNPERVFVVLGIYKHYQGSLSSLKTILHRRHFPLGGHVTTATRETTSNAVILLRWVMFGLVKYTLGIVFVTK